MLSGIYNITCEQGATFIRLIEIEYPHPTEPDVYLDFDLSGYSARMQIRRTIDSSTTMVSLDSDSLGGIEMQPGGIVNAMRITMTDAQTASITSDGVYDLEIVAPTDEVSRVIRGTFTLSREVTR